MTRNHPKTAAFALVAGAVLVALAFLIRGEAILLQAPFNPDEAELLAEGRLASLDLVPMSSSAVSTHLFLWPMVLGLLDLAGITLSLRTAHILTACAYSAIALGPWIVLALRFGWLRSSAFILPAFVILISYSTNTYQADFLSMGSELLSAVLLVIGATYAALASSRRITPVRILVVVGACASLSVLAKPQALFLAFGLCVCAVLLVGLNPNGSLVGISTARRFGALAIGIAAPLVLAFVAMLVGGTLGAFYREPIRYQVDYTLNRDVLSPGVEVPNTSKRIAAIGQFLGKYVLALGWAIAGCVSLLSLSRIDSGEGSRETRTRLVIVALPIVMALGTLIVTFPMYDHYANWLYCAAAICACLGGATIRPTGTKETALRFRDVTPFMPVVALVAVVALLVGVPGARLNVAALSAGAPAIEPNATVSRSCPPGSRVLVLGWASELYSEYNWLPASRYVNTGWATVGTDSGDYYRRTLLSELRQEPPRCIVEAFGAGWFGDWVEPYKLDDVVPGFGAELRRCYSRVPVKTIAGYSPPQPRVIVERPVRVLVRNGC